MGNISELGRLSGAYSVLETLAKAFAPILAGGVMEATIEGSMSSFVFLTASMVLIPGAVLAFVVPCLYEDRISPLEKSRREGDRSRAEHAAFQAEVELGRSNHVCMGGG